MRSLLAATALLLTGATAVLAQAPDAGQPAAPAAQPDTPRPEAPKPDAAKVDAAKPEAAKPVEPVPGQPATLTGDLRPTFVAQAPSDMVASKLVGLTIQNASNETIGEIADVVLDEGARVKSWIVGVGGFLGIGTKYVAVDPSAMRLVRAEGNKLKATINTDKDQLRAAPEYVYLGQQKKDEPKK
ncbi:PRC-barrel domain-containing protein [Methylobacterium oxalidis]|uniref:PRC-barrel domain-containing protein n=1 Tax=Methylobacterium oxalidis TaxID=944322 RepID=A0A512IYC4_9HYPH|nr:PRC-barrel domain-containing protein [Methylobacterium oxalidis]GEP02717.1 hypothetical protein MOX02_07550 [Methylobacterium oxalidis]GJE33577.1 hypothetical protein LDDCCGHA_3778 [Methylobacterium oxalidis]GLS66885.1 hypothetical protein GCM10007888_52680 [Methylobacterium oxalidis]